MQLEFTTYNNHTFLQAFAHHCGSRTNGNQFVIPQLFGKGYLEAFNFTSGISVLIYDMLLKDDLVVKRHQNSSAPYFVLHFNEIIEEPPADQKKKNVDTYEMRHNAVRLSSSLSLSQTTAFANYRMQSISIVFNKQSLLSFVDFDTAEKFFNFYFFQYLKKDYIVPIDADFRWVMRDIFKEVNSHPLKNLFVENRILLLLEKFLLSFMAKAEQSNKKLQFKEEDVSRLVKAENMLLEDFSKTPPTINSLSRICAMSPTKFKNDFKTLYGMPVYEYFQKNRMAYARTLIKDGEYAIKEVGMMVGYSNLGHFAAAFKKEFNMLPSEWLHANRLQSNSINEETLDMTKEL